MNLGAGGTTVLYADSSLSDETDLGSLLDDFEVRTVSTADAVRSQLDESTCVVLTDALPATTCLDLLAEIREQHPILPVIVYPYDGSEALAARVSTFTATRYLPQESDTDTVAEQIRDAVDVSEQRRDHRRHSTILRSLFDQIPYSLYVKDEHARHAMLSDVFADREELIGQTDLDWFGDQDPELARQTYQDDMAVLETGEPILKQEEYHDRGEPLYTETTKVPWYDDAERIQGLIGMSIDITDRKELEHELERKRSLHRRIARYVAHDIRNPLNLARGYLDLVRESPSPERFDKIADALDRIENVVTDMEVITGEERATLNADRTPIELRTAVTDAWNTIDPADATLQLDVPAEALIHADRSPLQELFENLIRNAVEHGGRDVTVRVGLASDGFYVADDGAGLPADVDDVFQYGVTTERSGSGLGLAIVNEIASTYDWTLAATESADGGARFEVTDCHLIAHPPENLPGTRHAIDTDLDLGDATPSGYAEHAGDIWTVAGGGENIWRDTDECHFAYAEVPGDARITCRLTDLERVEEYTKAGAMIRTGLAESDPFGFVGMTAAHGSEVLWRSSRGTHATTDQFDEGATLPHWYRLVRTGEYLTAFVSEDGEAWTPIDQFRIPNSESVYVGVAACSHDSETLTEAQFEDVTVEELEAAP